MGRIETYLFRQAAAAFIGGLFTLTAVIWVTQALRQLDLLTTKGQTILVFLAITGLGLPFLMAVIAPVALFASVLYCLNKLNSDSELVVMGAAGVSTAKLMSPFVILFTLVFGSVAALHLEIMPNSFNAIEALTAHVHADFISNFARPGAFVELESGFVFHYREHAPDGSLRGVFIQDRRDPAKVATFISETGEIVEKDGETYLLLLKGSTQTPRGANDSSIITFDDYAIELSQFMHKGDSVKRPRERSTWDLIYPNPKESLSPSLLGQMRAELVDRFTAPLYAFAAGLIAFAALGEARTTRQSRGWSIVGAVVVFAAVRILGITLGLLMRGKGGAPPPTWVPLGAGITPLLAAALSLDAIFSGPIWRLMGSIGRAAWVRVRLV